jgi:glycosyltransferase involved in cell wall biosynthesis
MMKKIIALSFIASVFIYAEQDIVSAPRQFIDTQESRPRNLKRAKQSLLTVVLMVKNEEEVMAKTLEPLVLGGVDSFLIFDTGSTDRTIEVTKEFFKDHNIEGYVIAEEPFIDFATSRNHALEVAEREFPDSGFFLFLDAEWYTHNVKGLLEFCAQELDKNIPCYLMRIMNNDIDFSVPRLIRVKSHSRFTGSVHEIIATSSVAKIPNAIYFELGVSRYGFEKSQRRWKRDVALLQKEHDKNPNDPRTTFYLAQTYECLGDLENAFHYYKIRSGQEGWHEENYETFYRLGHIADRLSAVDSRYTWNMAFDYYATAHNILPHRAEPLVKIASHYWQDGAAPINTALCYLFAKRACELGYPERDLLFIDPTTYKYKRYELLSKSAWHIGDFDNGELATRNALQAKEMPHLLHNLAAYIGHRAEQAK